MSWVELDDNEVLQYLDILKGKREETQPTLDFIETITENLRQIQTKTQSLTVEEDGENVFSVIKVKPKDQWGDDMTDEYRLQVKAECAARIDELLEEDQDDDEQ